MAEQEKKEKKKVSIGEALETLRGGGPAVPKKAITQAPRRRMGRPTAAFWIRNLQESIQRRIDHLYDSIREDPGARAQMLRRDFYASERFVIPTGVLQEVAHIPEGSTRPETRVARFSDLDKLDIRSGSDLKQVERSAPVTISQTGAEQLRDGIDDIKGLEVDKTQPGQTARFGHVGKMDMGQLVFEEVKVEPKQRPKKLKVNPMIRKMFERRSEGEGE